MEASPRKPGPQFARSLVRKDIGFDQAMEILSEKSGEATVYWYNEGVRLMDEVNQNIESGKKQSLTLPQPFEKYYNAMRLKSVFKSPYCWNEAAEYITDHTAKLIVDHIKINNDLIEAYRSDLALYLK